MYVPSTSATRIVDTVEFFPKRVPLPHTSAHDILVQAASDLVQALQHPHPPTPYSPTPSEHQALQNLADIFQHTTSPRVKATAPQMKTKKDEQPIPEHAIPPRVETKRSTPNNPAAHNNKPTLDKVPTTEPRQTRNTLKRTSFVED